MTVRWAALGDAAAGRLTPCSTSDQADAFVFPLNDFYVVRSFLVACQDFTPRERAQSVTATVSVAPDSLPSA